MKLLIPQHVIGQKTLHDYRHFATVKQIRQITALSKKLQRVSIAHFSVTPHRGGVAVSLQSSLPVYASLGLDVRWYTLRYSNVIFQAFRSFRDIFQGSAKTIEKSRYNAYLAFNKQLSLEMKRLNMDVWVIHDYQPLPAIHLLNDRTRAYIWHFHQDYSKDAKHNAFLTSFLREYLSPFSRYIFSSQKYIPDNIIDTSKATIFTPCIDPLNLKNQPLSKMKAWGLLKKYGISPQHPVVAQISRFNPWKDPLGVLQAFFIARKHIPDLQLVFMSHFVSKADPEQVRLLHLLKEKSNNDPNIIYIINARQNDLVVNALHTVSDVIVQKSLREGFGQTVTEGMWKKKAVIGGDAVGIHTQITSGVNGIIVGSVHECAEAMVKLLTDKKLRNAMGAGAYDTVKRKFLLPTYICNNLKVCVDVLSKK